MSLLCASLDVVVSLGVAIGFEFWSPVCGSAICIGLGAVSWRFPSIMLCALVLLVKGGCSTALDWS